MVIGLQLADDRNVFLWLLALLLVWIMFSAVVGTVYGVYVPRMDQLDEFILFRVVFGTLVGILSGTGIGVIGCCAVFLLVGWYGYDLAADPRFALYSACTQISATQVLCTPPVAVGWGLNVICNRLVIGSRY
jgi:hypothetical protein